MQPSMPRPSTSTFMNRNVSMSSLSHSITWRSAIAAGSIGTSSSSRSRVSTKPPGCWREMAGEADQGLGELERQAQAAVLQVEVELRRVVVGDAAFGPDRDLAGERAGDVLGQAERLADVAHRAAGAVADHGGAERGAVAAVGVVDPLDHLLAPLVLEIDVDVGRLAAGGGDETLEQQAGADRVDRGDAEHVADRAVRRAAAALAEDAAGRGRSGRCCARSGNRERRRAFRSGSVRGGAARRPGRGCRRGSAARRRPR